MTWEGGAAVAGVVLAAFGLIRQWWIERKGLATQEDLAALRREQAESLRRLTRVFEDDERRRLEEEQQPKGADLTARLRNASGTPVIVIENRGPAAARILAIDLIDEPGAIVAGLPGPETIELAPAEEHIVRLALAAANPPVHELHVAWQDDRPNSQTRTWRLLEE